MLTSKTLPLLITSFLSLNPHLYAEVVSDGTMGTVVTSTGTNFLITGDRQEGGNLFHSFQLFNVKSGESATFTGPGTVTNILARVTGGQASSINGGLHSDIPGANLYLLNPHGIQFGEHASLNISGSFHASTANYVRLGENGYFYTNQATPSVLSVALPSAFGFSDNPPALISIEGNSSEIPKLEVQTGKDLSLIGGNLLIKDGVLSAPNGRINLTAVASAGEVVPTATNLTVTATAKLGDITLSQSSSEKLKKIGLANVDVSGNQGGQIFIRTGQFYLNKARVFADTSGNGNSSKIDISVTGDMHLNKGARITADNNGNGQGGRIAITANTLQLSGQNDEKKDEKKEDFINSLSTIATNNFSSGKGGNIEIQAPILEINPGLIQAATKGNGDAGSITIQAQRVMLKNGGFINAGTTSSGQAGNITINATQKISLSNTSSIATQKISLSNTSSISGSASSKSSGNAGNLRLYTPQLILENKGQISSFSLGRGKAGSIMLTTDTASATQESGIYGGEIVFTSKTISLTNNSGIYSIPAQGKGSSIFVQAYNRLYVDNSAIITATLDAQDIIAGGVNVQSDGIIILNNSLLVANAVNGGYIFIKADQYIPSSDSVIRANSVTINAPDVNLSGFLTAGSQPLLKLPGLSLSRCASFSKEHLSRFLITSRDVLPPTPEDLR